MFELCILISSVHFNLNILFNLFINFLISDINYYTHKKILISTVHIEKFKYKI